MKSGKKDFDYVVIVILITETNSWVEPGFSVGGGRSVEDRSEENINGQVRVGLAHRGFRINLYYYNTRTLFIPEIHDSRRIWSKSGCRWR